MRTIVTGGAGFIGSHVVEALLARGDEVHVVDDLSKGTRENVPAAATLHVHDVREPLDALAQATGAEAIVHLAAQADVRVSVAEPAFDAAVNVVGTVNVLEAARLVGARVVFASTGGAIYGECARPAREDDPCLPLSPYGAAKLAGEGYLGAFGRLFGTPHLALRFGNVYGPRQDPHGEAGVVAIFLGRLLAGEPCRIFGDGSQSPRLRLRRRRRAGDDRGARQRRRRGAQHRHRRRDVRARALRGLPLGRRAPRRGPCTRRSGPASSDAASSTASSRPRRSGSGPRRRSRPAWPRPGSGCKPSADE